MEKTESGYQENFEDILRDAHLEDKNCTFYLVGMPPLAGKVKTVGINAIHLECEKGYVAAIRPQSIIAFFTQGVLSQQPGCPWCGE